MFIGMGKGKKHEMGKRENFGSKYFILLQYAKNCWFQGSKYTKFKVEEKKRVNVTELQETRDVERESYQNSLLQLHLLGMSYNSEPK